jgi:dolichyl-diphosphooligosaccharide---protein glycosyltransferase
VFSFDLARRMDIGNKLFDLQHFEEAFTSEHWLVRIYQVKQQNNRLPIKDIHHKIKP